MTRRHRKPFNGKQFIGNTNKNIVHDLDNEDTDENACQINEIKDEHVKTFIPDSLDQALEEEFEKCKYCLP